MHTFKLSGRRITELEVLFIFVVPVLLLFFEIIPRDQYLVVFFIYLLFVVLLIFKDHVSLKQLDIRTDNIKRVFVPYLVFTVVGSLALAILANMLTLEKESFNLYLLLLAWSIPIGIAQEFLYRGFLIHKLERLYSSAAIIILVNAFLFTLLHIIYNPPLLILPLTFLGGVGFAWMYIKYPNLPLIALSHGILNFVAIYYGFFKLCLNLPYELSNITVLAC